MLFRVSMVSLRPTWRVLNAIHHPTLSLRQQLLDAGQGVSLSAAQWLACVRPLAKRRPPALSRPIQNSKPIAGCHGQPWHQPPQAGQRGASWQLLDACLLAERLQRTVVSDFRSADLARGGQGRPRALTDAALYQPRRLASPIEPGRDCRPDPAAPQSGAWIHSPFRAGTAGQPTPGWPLSTLKAAAATLMMVDWALQGQVQDRWCSAGYRTVFQQQPPNQQAANSGRPDLQRRLQALGRDQPSRCLGDLAAFSAAVVAADLQRTSCD